MADDDLAYGPYHGRDKGEGERSLVGDTFRKLQQNDQVGSLFNKLHETVQKVGGELDARLAGTKFAGLPGQLGSLSGLSASGQHRYDSFARPREGNDVKWHVDGCGYFYAVSLALEQAKESIWILDWWLSPELYLRRPPSQNEEYRLDRMLKAAAERGVKVNVIVYKEVQQALTRKYLSPTLPNFLHSLLPRGTDPFTSIITKLGIHVTFASMEAAEREDPLIEPPIPVSSVHTKHALEALHPNIAVFRHPDHLPDAQTLQSSFASSFQNSSFTAETLAKLPGDAIKALYGVNNDIILYWAHHEKLLLIDGETAFMGGLDLCYGRWDTNQHPIADAHPEDLDLILFPGQDYNNARIMDFEDVEHWDQNKLDRKESSRMGWSDISISLHGPVVQDLRYHFVQRWNFIYNEKYDVRRDTRYSRLSLDGSSQPQQPQNQQPSQAPGQAYFAPPPGSQQLGTSQHQQQFAPPPGSYHQPTNPQEQFPPPPSWKVPPASQEQHYPPPPSPKPPGFDGKFPPPPPGRPPAGSAHYPSQQEQNFPPPPPGNPPTGGQPAYHYDPSTYSQPHGQYQYQPSQPSQPSAGNQGSTNQYYGGSGQSSTQQYFAPPPTSSRRIDETTDRGFGSDRERSRKHGQAYMDELERGGESLAHRGEALAQKFEGKLHLSEHIRPSSGKQNPAGGVSCQIVRSATTWSNGTPTEHSIQNAYATIIRQSQHFVYIENQFFITSTGTKQRPVQNTIGAAIVERILRAARAGEKYKVFVIIPSIPGFAGDLKDESSLGTRAIMEYQYNSINRGGHSIMEEIANAGFDPTQYIRFFNLRNYDRINAGSSMKRAEEASGVDYETARREHDSMVDPTGFRAQEGLPAGQGAQGHENYDKYQQSLRVQPGTGQGQRGRWDSVAECYMLGRRDIREVPWTDGDIDEMDAFVSEELYIHTKVLIADDRIVICGSANLNDRSQLGTHDSEIACVIEDSQQITSYMNGQSWRATKFAATLRRFLFRKHLGLVRPQDPQRPDGNFFPVGVPNNYDYDSPEDRLVMDPLADHFLSFWYSRARANSYAFGRIFHPVPADDVRTWQDYDSYYEQYFKSAEKQAEGKDGAFTPKPKYRWGHVVADKFSPGPKGVKEVKDLLSTIKGTLVDMPLLFLIKEDIAKQGLTLNALTEEVYT